jgi:hypothetical protein
MSAAIALAVLVFGVLMVIGMLEATGWIKLK